MNLKQQLAQISKNYTNNSSNIQLANGKSMLQVVEEELRKLEGYIRDNLENYFRIYDPHQYIRTGAMMDSIIIEKPKMAGNEITARILFNDLYAYHPSVMGSDQPYGYVPWLLEVGWDIRDKVGRDIPMFTHHSGIQYIKEAVERFNSENRYGIQVSVYNDGERYI